MGSSLSREGSVEDDVDYSTTSTSLPPSPSDLQKLREELNSLEEENKRLTARLNSLKLKYPLDTSGDRCRIVRVPEHLQSIFKKAEIEVLKFFQTRIDDPLNGIIEICGQRYILIRGPALTVEFYHLVKALFEGKEKEAFSFVTNMMFDLGHNIGKADANNYFEKMNLTNPISKLSAGPVHFAFTGWGIVEILPESSPTANEDFFLLYDHQYSFEAESYSTKIHPRMPTCHLNAGYSSGWCEESFGLKLVAMEIQCLSRGDSRCRFIMASPERIIDHIAAYKRAHPDEEVYVCDEIPGFFERRNCEEQTQRKAFNELKEQHVALKKEREKVVSLLKNMFPESVVQKMQLGQEIVAQKHENVTILFADVVDFTNTSASLGAEVVIEWLNSLFCAIDRLTDKHHLEKIKTIGDAYMLAGGISIPRKDHATAVLNFALELVDELRTMRDPNGKECKMRIGICTGGPVCSGVIGKKKFIFDVWGDCVNLASRMQALSEPGKIHCTESVKAEAGDTFLFEERAQIQVSGRGTIRCYYCTAKQKL